MPKRHKSSLSKPVRKLLREATKFLSLASVAENDGYRRTEIGTTVTTTYEYAADRYIAASVLNLELSKQENEKVIKGKGIENG